MKKILIYLVAGFVAVGLISCSDFLDIQPKDKISGDVLFSSEEGVEVFMANLYSKLPIEDFRYMNNGFFQTGNNMMAPAMFTDEATHSEFGENLQASYFGWWSQAWTLIRSINILSEEIPNLSIAEDAKTSLEGEVAFLRGYAYFGLAKRYGGVPIIDHTQQWNGDVDELKVPRSTEKETWDYVLNQLDIAVEKLPETASTTRRANKYVAAALESRAALFAASVAKFNEKMTLSGQAVTKGYVGMDPSYAKDFYDKAISAAETVISSGKYSLYMPEPATREEAAINYNKLSTDPNSCEMENMFIKGFTLTTEGHNYGLFYQPNQTRNGWPHPGRMDPNLELVDQYENYSAHGESIPITTSDNPDDQTDYNGFNPSRNYYKFDNIGDIFADKDARLEGTVLLPGSTFKNITIVIQAGLIQQNGTAEIKSGNPYVWPGDGNTYYVFGAANNQDYSGFDAYGGNYTRTGFLLRKFLEPIAIDPVWEHTTTDWVDIRYAEVLLNYAEAVYESGNSSKMSLALSYINALRRRAAFTEPLTELTSERIQRERLSELAFENEHFWDLIRRREYAALGNNRQMHALLPILDFRGGEKKYIFVRSTIDNRVNFTFLDYMYYHSIPGTGSNGLTQNPNY